VVKPSGPEDTGAKPQALRNLARDHFRAERFDEAIAALDLAERSSDATPAALKMRMLALIKLGRAGAAAELMPRMLAVERSDEHWLLGVARMAMRLEHWHTGVEVWCAYRRIKPGDEECLRGLLKAGCLAGQYELARDAAETLVVMGHDETGIRRAMICADVGLGDVGRAAERIRELFASDERGTSAWLDECEGPWWILVATRSMLDASDVPQEAAIRRLRLQATAFATALSAEVRQDTVAAYAAYRAASLAGEDSADVCDGLERMRDRLAAMLAGEGDVPLATADAVAAMCSDDTFFVHWKPLMARMAAETEWERAARRLVAALPLPLKTRLLAEMERSAASGPASGDPDAAHYRGVLQALEVRVASDRAPSTIARKQGPRHKANASQRQRS